MEGRLWAAAGGSTSFGLVMVAGGMGVGSSVKFAHLLALALAEKFAAIQCCTDVNLLECLHLVIGGPWNTTSSTGLNFPCLYTCAQLVFMCTYMHHTLATTNDKCTTCLFAHTYVCMHVSVASDLLPNALPSSCRHPY